MSRDALNGLKTGTTIGNVSDTRSYSGFAELDSYSATYSGTEFFSTQFTRDKIGRIVNKTETIEGVTNTYVYTRDLAGRLTGVELNGARIAAYSYDPNGNRLSFTDPGGTIAGTYDAQDRLVQYGSTIYTYTANGELLTKTTSTGTTTYSYDELGNLTRVNLPGGTVIDYPIDGQNRRIGRRVNGALVQGFLYHGRLKPIAELDGSNNVVSRFIYATNGNVPDYMTRGGNSYRIISDHLGSPRVVINTATGQIIQRIDYDEFGNVLLDTNPGFQPFGFAGGIYDLDTNLIRFGARDYDPETGRWTAKDPIGFGGGDPNFYAYVLNDPVSAIDPTGLQGQKSLCDALAELCEHEKEEGPENFSNFTFGNELDREVTNPDPDAGRFGENFQHDDGRTYDINYVQVGYQTTKQYTVVGAAGAYALWTAGNVIVQDLTGLGSGETMWSKKAFKAFLHDRGPLNPNQLGFLVGMYAAQFDTFCDFVADFCRP